MTLEAGIRACEKDAHCQIKIIAEVLHLVSCSTGRVGGGSSAQALPLRAAMSHAGNHASFQRFARRCWTACRPCEPCLPTADFEACAPEKKAPWTHVVTWLVYFPVRAPLMCP